MLSRRSLLNHAGVLGFVASLPSLAEESIDLGLPGGDGMRKFVADFPQKGKMLLLRTRAPLLETPFEVFDDGVFTPNDRFYVRWHWADIPTAIDTAAFRLAVRGHVEKPLSLDLDAVMKLPRVELAAVNQCSGNSRGFFQPRVAGGEWGNGAMGNALWTGCRLKDLLDHAGVKAGAVEVRFKGLDEPSVSDGPKFIKTLKLDRARDGEVMVAYAMNGKPLPLHNGFPLRLIVPGWYATYWIKMLNDIEIVTEPDQNFWMKPAYMIPDRPNADMKPGETGVPMVPISRMLPRSFITNIAAGAKIAAGAPVTARGIAFGGDCGVAKVEFSADGGQSWAPAKLGPDQGKYGFRRWDAPFSLTAAGEHKLQIRCTNSKGEVQPDKANWNPSGYMRNIVETTPVTVI